MVDELSFLTLSEVCEVITDGAHTSPTGVEEGVPMASVKDMRLTHIDIDSCKRISEEDASTLEKQNNRAQIGDILIAKDGSILKHMFVFRQQERVILLSSIAILRTKPTFDPHFVLYCLQDPRSMYRILRGYTSGSAIPRFVLKEFRKYPIPNIPLEAQKEIVAKIRPLDDAIFEFSMRIRDIEQYKRISLPTIMGDYLGW